MSHFSWRDDNVLILHCHVQPNAGRSEVAGLYGDALKIRLQAPPVDGKANQALIQFLGDLFGVPKSQIALLRGHSSRRKVLSIVRPQRIPPECFVTLN